MDNSTIAEQIFNRHYLEMRARILELAACLDRIERADGVELIEGDARFQLIRAGIEILQSEGFDRAERVQMLFSDPYVPNWKP